MIPDPDTTRQACARLLGDAGPPPAVPAPSWPEDPAAPAAPGAPPLDQEVAVEAALVELEWSLEEALELTLRQRGTPLTRRCLSRARALAHRLVSLPPNEAFLVLALLALGHGARRAAATAATAAAADPAEGGAS